MNVAAAQTVAPSDRAGQAAARAGLKPWLSLRRTGLTPALALFLIALMAGPVVMYLALVHHAEREALKDARAFSSVISIVRSYYANNVTGRIMAAGGAHVSLSENYREMAGGVPIPATLSIELGDKIRTDSVDQSLQFSFVSDAPFLRRPRPPLTDFQGEALKSFRREDSSTEYWRVEDEDGMPRLRLAVPVRMEAGCVNCHNVHPDSPVRNWKVGDVRGIQEVSVDLAVLEQADQSGFLGGYMLFFLGSGLLALGESRRNNARLRRVNEDLDAARRQAEQREAQLKDTVDELGTKTTVIERAPFGVLLAAPGGGGLRFSYVNPAFCQQTGYRSEELQGAGLTLLFGPQTAAPSMQALQSAIQGIQTTEVDMVLHRRDASPMWARVLLFPTFDAQQRLQHYVACVSDISEIRRAEEERQRMAGELHESMKLESLGLTIAGIAHDLNTPIGVAITAASHLEEVAQRFAAASAQAAPKPEETQRFVDRLSRSIQLVRNNLTKAAVLVRSFKQTTADATRTEWRRVDLKSFLDTMLVSVSPLMKRARCEVAVSCPEHLMLRTEPGSLGRALTNLLVNATIHAFEGRDERQVRIDVTPLEDGVRISCADNGVGMSEEAVTKAFTPFFTTRRGAGGSGLGLFSSRRTVEQVLGGKLTLESTLGAGTIFHIDLPLDQDAHDATSHA
jgi:PAS domain S-box-containing protein